MKNIYILWATVRPEMMNENWKNWENNCVTDTKIFLKVAVLTEKQKNKIDSYNIENCDVIITNEENGYNYALTVLTRNLEVNDDDIIITVTDDFSSPEGWDRYILNKFNTFDGAIFLDDGYQDKNVKVGALCITIACLTFNALKKLNRIVFPPYYKHFFSDNEAFTNFYQLGILKDDRDIDDMQFTHGRSRRTIDKYDERNMLCWDEDKITLDKRMIMSLKERLK